MTAAQSSVIAPTATILIVEDDPNIRLLLAMALRPSGYQVLTAENGQQALDLLNDTYPDLIITDIAMPEVDGIGLLSRLRANPATAGITVMLLTVFDQPENIIQGFDLGADDYLLKPIDLDVLRARVRAILTRPPIPAEQLERDRRTGMLKLPAIMQEIEREQIRIERHRLHAALACIELHEYERLTHRLGSLDEPISRQIADIVGYDRSPLEIVGRAQAGRFVLLLPELAPDEASRRLKTLAQRIAAHDFHIRNEHLRFTPVIGFTMLNADLSAQQVYEQAAAAMEYAGRQLDLQPARYLPSMQISQQTPRSLKSITSDLRRVDVLTPLRQNARIITQLSITLAVSLLGPFLIYLLLGPYAGQITNAVYLAIIIALLGTAGLIWYEGLLALRRDELPQPTAPYPPASAIIPAYLPNEAATILSTLEAFQRLDYPGPLQIILAYNTPRKLPIEQELEAMARRDPRLTIMRVQHSTSKAQNVNAALGVVTGEFVGIYDADHQPDPDSFRRAWSWLSNGYDIVQGHCLIRNGDASSVARTIAVEFEAIYAVSHPGRARLHGFGIFGGSNGFWKTNLLRETRMHGFMLTEDIDSSMRVVEQGGRIKSDPLLISRELAPTTLSALWNQRMRWAQGWFQVSAKHILPALRSPKLTWRQKLGVYHLLAWREIYPWVSIQILPIIGYWAWANGGLDKINWFVPIFVVTTLVTLATGPGQLLFVRRVGDPAIARRTDWLWRYLLLSFFYAEYKNLIARVAQIKEISGERKWKTTPRG